jgi:hypothetical protein
MRQSFPSSNGDFETSTVTWPKLSHRPFCCAAENGFHLAANGTQSPVTWYLYYLRFRKCHRKAEYVFPVSSDYHQSYIRSDRRMGCRPDGACGPRRKNTTRAMAPVDLCPVRLAIGVDSSGFFVFGGWGAKEHRQHPQLIARVAPLASRELSLAGKMC